MNVDVCTPQSLAEEPLRSSVASFPIDENIQERLRAREVAEEEYLASIERGDLNAARLLHEKMTEIEKKIEESCTSTQGTAEECATFKSIKQESSGKVDLATARLYEKRAEQLQAEADRLLEKEQYGEAIKLYQEASKCSQAVAVYYERPEVLDRAPRCTLKGKEELITEQRKEPINEVQRASTLSSKEDTAAPHGSTEGKGLWKSVVEKFWHPTSSFVFVAWMEQSAHYLAEAVKHNVIPGLNAEVWGIAGGIIGLYVSREANACLHDRHDDHSPHKGVFAHWRKFHDAAVTFAGHVTAGWLFAQAASFALVPVVGHSTLLVLAADGVGRWLYHVAEDWVRERYRKSLVEPTPSLQYCQA